MSTLSTWGWGAGAGLVAGLVIHVLPVALRAANQEQDETEVSVRWAVATTVTLLIYSALAGLSALALTEPSRGDAILAGLAVQTGIKGFFATAEELAAAGQSGGE